MSVSIGAQLRGQHNVYVLSAKLGEGSFGDVYRGGNEHGTFALKVLRAELIGDMQRRFRAEIRILGQIRHVNIVPILDWGVHEGQMFYVMPEMTGGTLATVIQRNRTWPEVLGLVAGVAKGLAAYHALGPASIHRDVKPENILLSNDRIPRLADFGVAACPRLTGVPATRSGLGTEAYMGPEVWRHAASQASDIYALGIVLSELANGRRHDVPARPPRLVSVGADLGILQKLYEEMTNLDSRLRPSAFDVARRCEAIAKQLQSVGAKAAAKKSTSEDAVPWIIGGGMILGLIALAVGGSKKQGGA
jgi:serine/threonine protein kinase